MKKSDRSFYRGLFLCGLLLTAMEVYKQLLLYYVIYDHYFDWWFFPFHLCSVPIYLCLASPWLPARARTICCTFMQNFNLLGAAAALIAADGFPRQHWYLLFHAYVWHILLLLIGLWIAYKRHADQSLHGFLVTIPLFISCCLIATAINVFAPGRQADMFYISPYHPIQQPIFQQIGARLGILWGHLCYLLSIIAGAGVIHFLFGRLSFFRNLW